jgi:acyclic sesquiterpene synthase
MQQKFCVLCTLTNQHKHYCIIALTQKKVIYNSPLNNTPTLLHFFMHRPRQTNQDLLALGVMDFTTSQTIYQQELELLDRYMSLTLTPCCVHLERSSYGGDFFRFSWVKESRLDQLPFARMKLTYFYLSAAGTMFSQELSDARIFWAMNGVLTTVVDDFFDVGGSKEELENLTTLVEM